MYRLDGCNPPAANALRDRLMSLGDSVAIAAAPFTNQATYSVHVHTDDAGAAVEAGLAAGRLSRIVISALSSGRRRTDRRAAGRGNGRCWPSSTATAPPSCSPARAPTCCARTRTRGDPATDISAHQLVRAVVDTGAAQVMVLPNGYVAAEELVAGCTAAIGWGIDVVPIPTGSMVQGLAALAVHETGRQAVDDGYTMARAAGGARHGSVRIASRERVDLGGSVSAGRRPGHRGWRGADRGRRRGRGGDRTHRSAAGRRAGIW